MLRRPHTTGRRTTTRIVGEERRDGSDDGQKAENPQDDSDPLRPKRRLLFRFPLTALFVLLPAAAGAGIVATCLRRFHDHPILRRGAERSQPSGGSASSSPPGSRRPRKFRTLANGALGLADAVE